MTTASGLVRFPCSNLDERMVVGSGLPVGQQALAPGRIPFLAYMAYRPQLQYLAVCNGKKSGGDRKRNAAEISIQPGDDHMHAACQKPVYDRYQ